MRHDKKKIGEVKWMMALSIPVRVINRITNIPIGTLKQIKNNETHLDVSPIAPDVELLDRFIR